jgi:hypothetical protein
MEAENLFSGAAGAHRCDSLERRRESVKRAEGGGFLSEKSAEDGLGSSEEKNH